MRKYAISLTVLSLLQFFVVPGHSWRQTSTQDGQMTIAWERTCFYYSLHRDGSKAVDYDALVDIAERSFSSWQTVQCANFQFVATEPAGVEAVEFNADSGNVNLLVWRKTEGSWVHDDDAVALTTVKYDQRTGEILDADIEFNEVLHDFGAVDVYPNDSHLIDLESTMTHEIGHCIGLDHSDVRESTMASHTDPGETNKRTLDEDDIEGLCHIYPVSDRDECREPYCGLDLDGTSVKCRGESMMTDDSGCQWAPRARPSRLASWLGWVW